jgi:hypothetical protein
MTDHVLNHLHPNAPYMLKTAGQPTLTLRTDPTGRLEFSCQNTYSIPQTFELSLAPKQ